MAFRSKIDGATGILPGSVGGAQLANGAVGGAQLAAQAVTEAAVEHSGWQAPAYNAGWAGGPFGGPVQALEYRTHLDRIELLGAFHSTSAAPAATIATLPAGYTPAVTCRVPVVVANNGTVTPAYLEVQGGGALVLTPNLTASGADVYVSASIPR